MARFQDVTTRISRAYFLSWINSKLRINLPLYLRPKPWKLRAAGVGGNTPCVNSFGTD